MKTKTLSIITVCYNNKDGLKKTIDSVRNQTFKDYEFIIIDGGSNDGSKDVIEANKDLFSFWCSESDGGIYQGMNKGIDHATGEYCLFLNSGDVLLNNSVLANVFNINYAENILYGNVIRIVGNKKQHIRYPKQLTFYDFYKTSAAIHHQATFFKRDLFCKYGLYDETSYMNADWRFYFKTIVQNNESTRYLNKTISVCDGTGTSNSINRKLEKFQADIDFKNKLISETIPALAIYDYNNLCQKSLLNKVFHFIKLRFSMIIPLSVYKKIYSL